MGGCYHVGAWVVVTTCAFENIHTRCQHWNPAYLIIGDTSFELFHISVRVHCLSSFIVSVQCFFVAFFVLSFTPLSKKLAKFTQICVPIWGLKGVQYSYCSEYYGMCFPYQPDDHKLIDLRA